MLKNQLFVKSKGCSPWCGGLSHRGGLLQARIIWYYALVVTLQRTGKPQ